MINKIKSKVQAILGIQSHPWDEGSWTFFRVVTFMASKRGQKKVLFLLKRIFIGTLKRTVGINLDRNNKYQFWLKNHYPNSTRIGAFEQEAEQFDYQPKISIVLPTYNTNPNHLSEAIQSVLDQVYANWELCISDDNSTNADVRQIIEKYQSSDQRIKSIFRSENGHISANTNSAISIASGEYIAFMDHDDLLAPDAFFQYVKVLNQDRSIEAFYSDEDKVDEKGAFHNPYFKPDWSPDTLLSRNYICHFVMVRKSIVDGLGGLRIGFEGAQDYDFLLRLSEKTNKIHHVSKILYHWRLHPESTAQDMDSKTYVKDAGKKSVEEALKRRNIDATVEVIDKLPGFYQINYAITKPGKVSIVIPSKDLTEVTNTCINSIFERTNYPDFEVILMNNNSSEDSFFEMVKKWETAEPNRFKCITDNDYFNFSRLMNKSVAASNGEFVLLLNNDTEVLHSDWLTHMVGYSQQERMGAVGVRLLFPDDTIQHAGVVIGLNGIAGHFLNCRYKDDILYSYTLQATTNYSAVTAACLMVRREVYDEVEGFDENLAVEFNDVDFCLRLKDKGYDNVYLPHVTLYHYESISRGHPHKTKESYDRHVRELALFKERWQKYIDHDPYYNTHLSRIFSDAKLRVKPEKLD